MHVREWMMRWTLSFLGVKLLVYTNMNVKKNLQTKPAISMDKMPFCPNALLHKTKINLFCISFLFFSLFVWNSLPRYGRWEIVFGCKLFSVNGMVKLPSVWIQRFWAKDLIPCQTIFGFDFSCFFLFSIILISLFVTKFSSNSHNNWERKKQQLSP